jgi:hypothetical protein
MDNQHRQIKGYRELDSQEIYLMNKVKSLGAELDAALKEVKAFNDDRYQEAERRSNSSDQTEEQVRIANDVLANHHYAEPNRWTAMARTQFQTGLMYLTRAVAKPEFL